MAKIFWRRRVLTMKKKKIIDLSFDLEKDMITFPSTTQIPFKSSILGRIEKNGRETRKFTMGSHCGTHIDAPKHFIKDGKSVSDIPLDKLFGTAVLIDIGTLNPGQLITKKIIYDKLKKIPKYPKKILIRTGWDRFWNTNQYYIKWPYMDYECAKFLCEKRFHLIGMDFPSPDNYDTGLKRGMDSPNHKLFFSKEIVLLEYLNNLNELKEGLVYLMTSPLKLKGFDGAPSRVTAYNI